MNDQETTRLRILAAKDQADARAAEVIEWQRCIERAHRKLLKQAERRRKRST